MAPHGKSTNVRLNALKLALGVLARISPSLAARALEALFLRVRKHPVPEREHAWLAGASTEAIVSRGQKLHAWSWGEGPTVLLAHGWEGRGSQMGAFVRPLLEAGYRVVSFDAPGHGRSPGNRSSIIEMAEAVVDAGRSFGPLHGIVGHSAGAAASAVALGRGLDVGRLVFIAPPSELEAFLSQAAQMLGLPDAVAALTQQRIEARFGVRWESLRTLPLARAMRTPLLVFHDVDDREVPVENGARLVDAWPTSRLVQTNGLGHRRILREPSVIEAAVAFLNGAQEVASWGATSLSESSCSTAGATATRSLPSSLA